MINGEDKMRKLLAVLLILVLLAIGLSGGVYLVRTGWKQGVRRAETEEAQQQEEPILHSPVVVKNYTLQSSQKVTYDCIWFGSYPQSDETGKVKEPIKWRVLSVEESKVFLVADCNLDVCCYHNATIEVSWEDSTIRNWLNNEFARTAFTYEEWEAMIPAVVKNECNGNYGTDGGDATMDRVFLLSLAEITNPLYGFVEEYVIFDEARERKNTAYVNAGGSTGSSNGRIERETGCWWLRSPGNGMDFAAYVNESGYVNTAGHNVFMGDYAVVPALYLSLSDSSLYSYAGTVCTDGTVEEVEADW